VYGCRRGHVSVLLVGEARYERERERFGMVALLLFQMKINNE
jgi:hypothetical protein